MPKIICVIAIHRRPKVTKETINLLKKQTLPLSEIIVVGDSDVERAVAKETGVTYHETKNRPLSNKWQSGIDIARFRKPDAILITGSDSWLSTSWCEIAYPYLEEGYDLVGKNIWNIINIENSNKPPELIQRAYEKGRGGVPIGVGRLWGKKILKKLNWKIFPNGLHSSLDSKSYRRLVSRGGKVKIINHETSICSLCVKGNWKTLNSWKSLSKSKRLEHVKSFKNPELWLKKNFPEAIPSLERLTENIKWK